MKMKVKSFLVATLLMAMCAPAVSHAQGKIGVVDLRKVFEGYYKTRLADAKIKDTAAELDKQREAKMEEFKNAQEAYKKAEELAKDLSVNADEADRRKSEAAKQMEGLQRMQKEYQAWERSAKASIDEQSQRMRARVLEEIESEVAAIAKSGNYFMILDRDAESVNQTKVIVYYNGENDVTKQVLANLNAGAPAGLKDADASTSGKSEATDKK